jgi:hypothetical protein
MAAKAAARLERRIEGQGIDPALDLLRAGLELRPGRGPLVGNGKGKGGQGSFLALLIVERRCAYSLQRPEMIE